jgi:hypothetical protein
MRLLNRLIFINLILLGISNCKPKLNSNDMELKYIRVHQYTEELGLGGINYVLHFNSFPKDNFNTIHLKVNNDSFPFNRNTYVQKREDGDPRAIFIYTDFIDMDTFYIKNTFKKYFINNTIYFFNDSTMIDSCVIKDKIKIIFNE